MESAPSDLAVAQLGNSNSDRSGLFGPICFVPFSKICVHLSSLLYHIQPVSIPVLSRPFHFSLQKMNHLDDESETEMAEFLCFIGT